MQFLTDENVGPGVVAGLRQRGWDVLTAAEAQLIGSSDAAVLSRATAVGRVVVTHDLAFGRDALARGTGFIGIIYMRPGHVSADFVLELFDAVEGAVRDATPPFVLP